MAGKTKSQTKLYAELLSLALKAQASKSFDTRKAFNDEKVWVLTKGHLKNEFRDELDKIRKRLSIPLLNPKDDWVTISSPTGESEMDESSWLYGHNDKFINEFESAVTDVLRKYKLPNNLREWIELQLLYRDIAKTYPIHYFDLAFDLLTTPEWINTTTLTTTEKRFVQKLIPEILGFKKRPPKKLAEQYKKIRELLDQSKNGQRRMRTLKTAKKTINIGNRHKLTYDEVVARAFSEDDEFRIGGEKLKARLRKQKQRLLQRHK